MKYPSVGKNTIMTIIGIYISFRLMPIIVNAEPLTNAHLLTKVTAETEMGPFYWMVIIVGGSIAVTLTYVSWRKYKAEKEKQINKDSNS